MMRPGSDPATGARRGAARPRSGEYDDGASIWAFVWTLFGFKMATVALLLYHMRVWESDLVIAATTWYWFPMLAVLLAAPIALRYRLRKARARREELMRSEWMVTGDDDAVASRRVGKSTGP
jgi:hypothetical protein